MSMEPSEFDQREILLERIGALVERDGLLTLTLETAAAAAEIDLFELQEYFDSKEDLIVELIARNRIRLREKFVSARRDRGTKNADLPRLMWEFYLETASDSRLFFEAYGLALHDKRYGEFMLGINDWLGLLTDTLKARGVTAERANALATITMAVYRGAMLDYCATGERARVNAAMELWFKAELWLENT
jgi:AcrR family transcriptional regulator